MSKAYFALERDSLVMLTVPPSKPLPAWKTANLLLFRFIFLYFLLHLLPIDQTFLQHLVVAYQKPYQYIAVFNLVNYTSYSSSYTSWVILALIAIAGTVIWTVFNHGRMRHYTRLHYWFRVVLRYKLSSVLLTYGFLLLFALWAPYPSISQLNTKYGDFTLWKHFTLSLGVSPFYQFFLGFVEVGTGLLLLYRKTVPFAALIALFLLGNVYASHVAYEGNLSLYSLYLMGITLILLSYDIPRIINLLIFHKPTAPAPSPMVMLSRRQQLVKATLKISFLVFFVGVYGSSTGSAYHRQSTYRLPSNPGLPGLEGIYHVTAFRLNDSTLPYSETDTIRWQDVVFEKWNTFSIRTYASMALYPDDQEGFISTTTIPFYELAGSSGRYYYSYEIDTLHHLLVIRSRSSHPEDGPLLLHYSLQPKGRILLHGTLPNKNPISVILDKIDKKYLLQEAVKTGRRVALKL